MFNVGDGRTLFIHPWLIWKMKKLSLESVPLYRQPVKTIPTMVCVCVTYY